MDYKSVNTVYVLGFLAILAVLVIYPRFHKILSNDFAVFGMAVLTFAIYGLLLVAGQSVGGVRAWFHGIQLTEFVKILFCLCHCRSVEQTADEQETKLHTGRSGCFVYVRQYCVPGDYFRVRYADCDGHCFSDFSVHFSK